MADTSTIKFHTPAEYLSSFPPQVQQRLQQLRTLILAEAPGAEEVISYNMPAFRLQGILVWYAAYKNHIGFYPKSAAIAAFNKELSAYKWAKGSVQFPLDEPLPEGLVRRMVQYRIKENLKSKKGKK